MKHQLGDQNQTSLDSPSFLYANGRLHLSDRLCTRGKKYRDHTRPSAKLHCNVKQHAMCCTHYASMQDGAAFEVVIMDIMYKIIYIQYILPCLIEQPIACPPVPVCKMVAAFEVVIMDHDRAGNTCTRASCRLPCCCLCLFLHLLVTSLVTMPTLKVFFYIYSLVSFGRILQG